MTRWQNPVTGLVPRFYFSVHKYQRFAGFFMYGFGASKHRQSSTVDCTIKIMVGWARQLRLAVSESAVGLTLFSSPPID